MRTRILISLGTGLLSGAFCWFLMCHFHQGAGDFTWSLRPTQALLHGQNPYTQPIPEGAVLYPLTASAFALPFVGLRPEIAAGFFYGCSSALLAFGLTRDGYSRLLVLFAYPYWSGFLTAQWSPLIMTGAFFPLLLPAALAKPQVGLPVALTNLSRRGMLACGGLIVLTLIVLPTWPLQWLHQAATYQYFLPMVVLPGPLLALALWRRRDRDAWLLFLASVMPQRWFYDAFILWLIPKGRREILWTAAFSWGAGIMRWYHQPNTFQDVGRWAVVFLYLPMLGLLISRQIIRSSAPPPNITPA